MSEVCYQTVLVAQAYLVALHACLQGADGVDLSDDDTCASSLHGGRATLADITIASDEGGLACTLRQSATHTQISVWRRPDGVKSSQRPPADRLPCCTRCPRHTMSRSTSLELTSNHEIGGAHDAVRQRVAAAVHVVELGLGHGVVHVDGGEQQLALSLQPCQCHTRTHRVSAQQRAPLRTCMSVDMTMLDCPCARGMRCSDVWTVQRAHLHLIETLDTGGGLLRHAHNLLGHAGPAGGVLGKTVADDAQHDLELVVVSGVRVGLGAVLGEGSLSLDTLCKHAHTHTHEGTQLAGHSSS